MDSCCNVRNVLRVLALAGTVGMGAAAWGNPPTTGTTANPGEKPTSKSVKNVKAQNGAGTTAPKAARQATPTVKASVPTEQLRGIPDECEGAESIACGGSATVDTSITTTNPGDPFPSCHLLATQGAGSAWFTFTASDVSALVSTCNSPGSFDTVLSVYSGTCGGLAELGCDDDTGGCGPNGWNSTVCVEGLNVGETYYVYVAAWTAGDVGETLVEVTCPCPPPPDCPGADCPEGGIAENEPDCGVPTDTVNGGCNSSPPVFTTLNCGDTYCGTAAFDGFTRDTDWYSVTITEPTELSWTVTASFPSLVGFVENSGIDDCAASTGFLNPFATPAFCETTTVSMCVNPGTYWAFVAPLFGEEISCGATYVASLACVSCTPPPPPPNDLCENAELIQCGSSTLVDNTLATVSLDDPFFDCSFGGPRQGFNTVWYTFVATDTSAQVSMCQSGGFDTLIQLYDGGCGALTPLACNDDFCGLSSQMCAEGLTVGNTYYIEVAAWDGTSEGVYTMDLTCPCPPPPNCEAAACPEGGIQENESDCGVPVDSVNGGCNSFPPVFSPLACGDEICGTVAFDGGTRDTDWYSITITEPTELSWTVIASFDALIGFVENGGIDDCAASSGFLVPFALPAFCESATTTMCVNPGTYWAFVAPQFTQPIECGRNYLASLSCTPCEPPPPPENDTCDTATALSLSSGGSVQVIGNNSGAADDLNVFCPFGTLNQGLWYTFVGTGNTVTIDTCTGTNFDTTLGVLTGTCGAQVCQVSNDDFCGLGSTVQLCTVAGQTYYVALGSFGAGTGDFTMTLTDDGISCEAPVPPANDTCGGAIPLAITPGGTTQVAGSNNLATDDPDAAGCPFTPTQQGVWYSIVGNGNNITVDTCAGASYDTTVGILTGTCGATTCVVGNDDFCGLQSSVTFCAEAGTTYYIVVGSFSTITTGTFTLSVTDGTSCGGPVLGDDIEAPISIDCNETLPVDNSNATVDPTDPLFTCRVGGATQGANTVWLEFTATGTDATITTCPVVAPADDSLIAVYDGAPGSLVQLGCNDDAGGCGFGSTLTVTGLTIGEEYYIELAGWGAADVGVYNVSLTCTGGGADCNENGTPDAQEIAANPALDCFDRDAAPVGGFFTKGGPNGVLDACECAADWNRDGIVGSSDITAFLASWFNDLSTAQLKADFDCNGVTGSSDITAFLNRWFQNLAGNPPFNGCGE